MPDYPDQSAPGPDEESSGLHTYRRMVEAAPCGMFVCDGEGVFRLVNPAFERLTGFEAGHLVGKLTFEALHDPAELASRRAELFSPMDSSAADQLLMPFSADFGSKSEWVYVHRNTSRINVSLTMTRLPAQGGIVGVVFDNTKRSRQDARLWYLSHHDALTGLPNQAQLEEQLSLAIQRRKRTGEPVLLTFVEIDNLRRLLDNLGQPAAETAIRQAAGRLREMCEPQQSLFMVGSTQFALLSPGVGRLSERQEIAILERVAQPVDYLRTSLHMVASIGSSSFPDAGDDPATLMRRALLALSASRNDGGNCSRHFDFSMQSRSSQRLDLEVLLREATDKQQFSLAYQPQVNLRTGKIALAEALLRWRHPIRGPIGPGDFIPVAEDMGLILPIGDWVLRTACKQAARIVAKFGESPRIAVNVSPVQFRRKDLLHSIHSALDAAALDPKYLELEITEGVLLNDTEHAISTVTALRKMGVEIAIDDFGTGYSSLSYLTRFQVDRIKIDRSLVSAMTQVRNGDAIVSAIIAMAHALDIRVTAEGVETEAQADRLRQFACDEVQGFWYSRPLTPQALDNALAPISDELSRTS